MNLIGVDIGGTHISAAKISNGQNGIFVSDFYEEEVNTSSTASASEIISNWAKVIRKSSGHFTSYQVGVSMPGPFDYPNGISLIQDQGKMISLYGISVKSLLAKELGLPSKNIQFTNDAEAFLLGESVAGEGRDFQNSIGITLGTGLGSAIKLSDDVKDAKLWTAPFRDGIAEDYLGTAWFKKTSKFRFGKEIQGVKDLIQPNFESEIAAQLFQEFGLTLGEFLLPYLTQFQIDGVVLGGKISLVANRFLPYTLAYLHKYKIELPIQISTLGEKSALIGACQFFLKQSV